MAKKLSTDYINWVLTLNAKQAHEEFHKLEKDNKELQQQTRESRKAMVELEKQGKKGSLKAGFYEDVGDKDYQRA